MPSHPEHLSPPAAAPRIAYQGTPGAFGEEAARSWRIDAQPYAVRTFGGVLDAVMTGIAKWAVIPVWNSAIGRVTAASLALEERADSIVRVDVVDVLIRHCLLALPGTCVDDVRFVGSHPAAFAQCRRLLAERSLIPCEAYNTAGAARDLAAYWHRTDTTEEPWYVNLPIETPAQLATISSAASAEHYGLVVLRHDVQDDPSNTTRFVVVRARGATSTPAGFPALRKNTVMFS